MKKRIISLTLALLMLASLLAGCGSEPDPTGAPTAATTEASPTQAPTTEAPTEAPTTVPPTVEAPTEAPTEPENSLALGIVEGNTYTNTYAGFGCTLDSNWVIYPADQLQELPEITQQMVEGTELEAALANVTQFTDMYAENVELLATANVLFQKLEMSQRLAYSVMDEKAVLEATLQQKDLMIEAYAQGGIMVESMEMVEVTFLGQTHWALKTVATNQGAPYYCLQLFDFWLGQYSMTLTLASFVEDQTAGMLELFHSVEE